MRPQAPTTLSHAAGAAALDRVATLPGLLTHVFGAFSNSQAFNWREAGYWRHCSTEDFCSQVRRCALGLHRLGLKRGEAVGILAAPSPAWLIADFAIMCAGGVSVPLFPNLSDDHLEYESRNSALVYLIAIGDQAAAVARAHHKLWRKVIVRNAATGDDKHVVAWNALLEFGDQASHEDPQLAARLRDEVKPDDIATIIHTSGSTGKPKGVVLTHGNLLMQVRGSAQRFPLDAAHDRALSCLPLAHVFERMVMYYYVAAGVSVWFADDIKKIGELLRELKPTVTTMVPRIAEKLHARIADGAAAKSGLGGLIGRWAVGHADRDDPLAPTWSHGVADRLVYRKVRDALGGRLKYLIMGGAALSPELTRFLLNVGAPLYVGYGLTEAAPVVACNAPGLMRPGSVGPAWPGVEIRIGERDEILARGAGIMRGYHRDPDATAATIDREGWLHTGDCGKLDGDGYLTITGRLKELFKTSNGKYVCPVPIEQALVASGLIDQAMVVAEARPYTTALLFAAPEALARVKTRLGCVGQDDATFIAGPEMKREVEALVARANHGFDHWEQVQKWRLVATVPSVEGGELTPTMKLKRHVVAQRHAAIIESMYAEAPLPALQGSP
ncbi:MAG: long-chain fatty acid--CoA ligase [Planctomycetes bacterium]|nr:long-chain fatty acid--CoA ligase [Planctomycetota bacterium]